MEAPLLSDKVYGMERQVINSNAVCALPGVVVGY